MVNPSPPSKASIVSIIREMVKAGESEANIIKSLKEVGIKEKDAKRLLLLGEADTFALLQSEINKMVREYFDREKPQLVKYIEQKVSEEEQEMVGKVEKRALSAFKEDQKFIENQATMFQARVNQSVKNILQLNQETKAKIADLAGRLSNTERSVWTIKERVLGSKTVRFISALLLTFEVALVAATAYLVLTGAAHASYDVMVVAGSVGAILATMIFLIRIKF
jgi:type I site-specific restriction endonuclease